MPTALITGGSGFLGMNLAEAMAEQGWTLRLLDIDPPPRDVPKKTKVIVADVRDEKAVDKAAKGCDLVVDNAAIVPIARASRNELRSVNVDGCRTVLRPPARPAPTRSMCRRARYTACLVCFPSPRRRRSLPSSSTGRARPRPKSSSPRNGSAANRLPASDPGPCSARVGSAYSSWCSARSAPNTWVPMFGRGSNILQMCHARDFSAAVMAAAEVQADGNYNIGAGVFGTVRDDLQDLIDRVGSTARLFPVPTLAGSARAPAPVADQSLAVHLMALAVGRCRLLLQDRQGERRARLGAAVHEFRRARRGVRALSGGSE